MFCFGFFNSLYMYILLVLHVHVHFIGFTCTLHSEMLITCTSQACILKKSTDYYCVYILRYFMSYSKPHFISIHVAVALAVIDSLNKDQLCV